MTFTSLAPHCSHRFLQCVFCHRSPIALQTPPRAQTGKGCGDKRVDFVQSVTCVRSCVSFQVERIVEAFAAEGAQVSLDI